ncbi:MAG TPA: hypothetical protein PLV83_02680 [Bacilli bacterium]|nr:hypothetical protein [Bacilli bacterium]
MKKRIGILMLIILIISIISIVYLKSQNKKLICHREHNGEKYQVTLIFKNNKLYNVSTDMETSDKNKYISANSILKKYKDRTLKDMKEKYIDEDFICDNKTIFNKIK